ncbi:MAG: DUF1385 domain-containing protein [Anaerolineae bacterium]|nr:DUF1385 domain-containing protein [Anaerolineae bacterium]
MAENETQSPKRTPGELKFSYGGQAVIEGVLMRGSNDFAIAVRDPEGQIVVHKEPLNKHLYRGFLAKTPFLRGIVGLWDAMGLGTKALMWSADVALGEEEDISFGGAVGFVTVAVSLLIGVGLFFLLPTTAATGIGNLLGLTSSDTDAIVEEGESEGRAFIFYEALPVGWDATIINLIESVIQLGLLAGYIWAISRLEDVKRLFSYHGAEHKTINAYEAGDELIPEVVAKYPIEHPRCGTAFLLTVVFVSAIVFSLIGRPPFLWLIISRIVFIPIIAGISYELLHLSAANLHRPWVRVLVTPNLMLQHLTTREPDLDMLEVAIVSFQHVLASEGIITQEEAVIPEAKPEAGYAAAAGD